MEGYWDILKEALVITAIVVALMAFIEVIDYATKGRITRKFRSSKFGQVLLGSALGAAPGCAGGYVTVSMYSQGAMGFSGLLAMMIATTGDESFLMLAQFPVLSLYIFGGLFALALVVGLAASRLEKGKAAEVSQGAADEDSKTLKERLKHLLPHAAKVLAWTLGVMLVVRLSENYIDLKSWIGNNTALMILFAVLVGMIPQSGPHMVFVTLYAQGIIPLPVLIASCITQDGHAGLPLIAQSSRDFFKIKGIKAAIALAAGYGWMLFL